MDINERIGRLLGRLHRGWKMRMARELEPLGLCASTAFFFLMIMHREGASQEEIASILAMDKGTTARAVQKLERQGLIERRRDPSDARRRLLFLSPEGARIVPRIRRIHHRMGGLLLGNLSDAEKENFYAFLERLVNALEDMP